MPPEAVRRLHRIPTRLPPRAPTAVAGGDARSGRGGRPRENGPVTSIPPRAAFLRVLGLLVLAASAAPLANRYLVTYPQEIWQVDLEVYREGARSLLHGGSLYDLRTPPPQFLPFTYPPFAAVVGLPLVLGSFTLVGWVWTVLQMGLLWLCVGIAFRPLLERAGSLGGLLQGTLAAAGVWFLPVTEGVRFGQVNAVIVALCLADVAGWSRRRLPQGVLVGLAVAVKLTPGVFWVHWAVTRQWRVLATSVATTAGVTLATAVLLPSTSLDYWVGALLDPERLGPNAGTSNQSVRGVLLRLGPQSAGLGTALWLGSVVVVCGLGFALSARLHRLGEPVGVVAVVGLVAVLVSPVSWVHHMHWSIVLVGALVGDGRRPARMVAGAAVTVAMWVPLPWKGAELLADPGTPHWVGRVLQNSYPLVAVLALIAVWRLVGRAQAPAARPSASRTAVAAGSSGAGTPQVSRTS